MVTNYPHRLARDEEQERAGEGQDGGFGTRLVDRLRQVVCGLHGHDRLLQFERDRMFLRCVSCGHETPGWELAETPRPVVAREETRPALVPAHLVSARRIA
jgi:hypothetical protein